MPVADCVFPTNLRDVFTTSSFQTKLQFWKKSAQRVITLPPNVLLSSKMVYALSSIRRLSFLGGQKTAEDECCSVQG